MTRDSVHLAVRGSSESQWFRDIVDQIRESSDTVEMVVELSEADTDYLRSLLLTNLFLFQREYEIQRQQTELERRADLNGPYMLTGCRTKKLFSVGNDGGV